MYLTRRIPRSDRCSQRGATIVEAALVLPVLLALIFGIIQFGILWGKYQDMTNAAREGARYAVAPCPFNLSIPSHCIAGSRPNEAQVLTRVQQMLDIANVKGALININQAASRGPINGFPVVYTNIQINYSFNVTIFNYNIPLCAEAMMRNED
jgi:hypothetical protein